MDLVHLNAYAKLNLTLDVIGREGGYHLLDSLVTTVDLFDKLTLSRRKDKLSRILMHGGDIPPESNVAQRAADAFSERFGTNGADVTIYKNIPIGAGMGGSSADIAGVIAGMGALYGVSDMGAMQELAASLGSDAPALLLGGLLRMRGRGELLERLPFEEMHFLVLVPRQRAMTARVYEEFDRIGEGGSHRTESALGGLTDGINWAARCFGNDLCPAACRLVPEVREAYLALKALSPDGISMTGSGSAVFACFQTKELCEWARSRYRGRCRTYVLKSVREGTLRG